MKSKEKAKRIALWQLKRSVSTERIIMLWKEIQAIREKYSEVGANDSEPDYALQGMIYAMSFDVPVQVPSNPRAYKLFEHQPNAKKCVAELRDVMKQIKTEFRTFYGGLPTDELDTWMKEKIWRYCRK